MEGQLLCVLGNGGDLGACKLGQGNIIKSNHPDLVRHFDPVLHQHIDACQSHHIIGSENPVKKTSLFPQQTLHHASGFLIFRKTAHLQLLAEGYAVLPKCPNKSLLTAADRGRIADIPKKQDLRASLGDQLPARQISARLIVGKDQNLRVLGRRSM